MREPERQRFRIIGEKLKMREVLCTCQLFRFAGCCCYGLWRWDRKSVSWDERGRSYRMWRVVAICVERFVVSGRCSVHVGCCVSLLVVVIECIRGIMRACGEVNEAVAIECGS